MDPMDETGETRAKRLRAEGRFARYKWQHLAIVLGLFIALAALVAIAV